VGTAYIVKRVIVGTLALLSLACTKGLPKTGPAGSTIRLAYAAIPQAGLVQVALAKGFFKDEGLDVIPQSFAFGKPALESVTAGYADLSTVAETPFIYALLDRGELCISAVIESSDRTTALVVNKAAGIGNEDDLVGKRIAVTKGTAGEYFLEIFLMARGLEKSEIRIIDMLPEAMLAGIMLGTIDAAAVWNPILLGISEALAADGSIFYGDDVYTEHFCIAGKQEFTRENPEAMRSFMRALIRAESYLRESPDKALAIIGEYSHTDKSSLGSILSLLRFRVSLDQTLPLLLEDEMRWAMKDGYGQARYMRDYTEYIEAEPLSAVAPERVRLIR